ncbi:MAG: acetyl-CoA C-acetyltransferase [Myxococcota bacterium]
MTDVVICSAARTPIGSLQGAFASLSSSDLGAVAIRAAVERSGAPVDQIDRVYMGNVLSAAAGQAPARQAAIKAGLPTSCGAVTISKVCGSGLQAVMFARREVLVGEAELLVAGGMESMTNAPYALPNARSGYRLGNGEIIDTLIHDGLWDPYGNMHMGTCGDRVAEKYGFTREDQDAFAAESYRRARLAQEQGKFSDEIVPVEVPRRRGDPIRVDADEEPARGDASRFSSLRPAFGRDGTVTAANASTINDGAAALVVASEARAEALGLPRIARILADSTAALDPEWFTIAPVQALQKLYARTSSGPADWDLYEINEAFSGVTLAAIKEHGLDPETVNVNGGAVSLGHPIGCSGARILVTLLHALRDRGKQRGIATLCIGGGEAVAMAVELL